MRRFIGAILALIIALSLGGGLTGQRVTAQTKEFKIGVVTDAGGIDDGSFIQGSWQGIVDAAQQLGVAKPVAVESFDSSEYEANLELFAERGYDVVISIGFALAQATRQAAAKFPNIHFIGIDYSQSPDDILPNITTVFFDGRKLGFLTGVLAARLTKSNTIGAVLGTGDIPPVVEFGTGLENGVNYIDKKSNLKINFVSIYHPGGVINAFNDPVWGAQTAAQLIDQGADVVFGGGGTTGNGAILEVAKRTTKDKPLYCIGVDVDQWLTVPAAQSCLVTSALKESAPTLVQLIKQAKDGTLKGGNVEGGIGLAPFHAFENLITPEIAAELKQVEADLESGALTTDGQPGKPKATQSS